MKLERSPIFKDVDEAASAWRHVASFVAIAIGVAAMLFITEGPVLGIAALAAVPATLLIAVRPELLVPLGVFVLYTNAGVIASNVHGAPGVVAGMSVAMFAVPVAYGFLFRRDRLLLTPSMAILVLFALWGLFGSVFALHRAESASRAAATFTEGFVLYLLVANAIRSRSLLRWSAGALVVGAALMGTLSLHQQATQNYDSDYYGFAKIDVGQRAIMEEAAANGEPGTVTPRLAGHIGEENRYAQVMLMVLPVAWFMSAASANTWARVAFGLAMVPIAGGVALTLSRGAMVGGAMVAAVMLAMGYLRLKYFAVAAAAVIALGVVEPRIGVRMMSLVDLAVSAAVGREDAIAGSDGAIRKRFTEMESALLVFVDHPFKGVGPGMFPHYYQRYAQMAGGDIHVGKQRRSHSLYLDLLAEQGVVGLGLFALLMVLALRDLDRARRRSTERDPELSAMAAAFTMALVAYLSSAVFLHDAYIRYFWLIMGMAGAVSAMSAHGSLGSETRPAPAVPEPAAALDARTV